MPAPSTRDIRAAVEAFRDRLDGLDAHATVGIGVHLGIVETQLGELDRELAAHAQRAADARAAAERQEG